MNKIANEQSEVFTSKDIDNQRITESDWPKGKPDHTKPRVLVLNATFT